jgi:hypothetical protein
MMQISRCCVEPGTSDAAFQSGFQAGGVDNVLAKGSPRIAECNGLGIALTKLPT